MIDPVLGPQAANDLDAFLEPADPLIEGHAEGLELLLAVAHADAEGEVAPGDPVERRGLLGDDGRVQHGEQDYRGAKGHPLALGGEPRQ